MITLATLTLPPGLVWSDEFASAAVSQTARRTLGGSMVVMTGALTGGQPITLESEPDAGWLTRTQVQAISLLAASPGAVYPLLLRGQTHQVMFRHQDAPAFDAHPIFNIANPGAGHYYTATLKLITI